MRVSLSVVLLVLQSLLGMPVATASDCFERIAHPDLPFEWYVGVARNRHTYLQQKREQFSLATDAIAFLAYPAALKVAALCNGYYIAVWLPESFGSQPAYLTARLFRANYRAVGPDFRVTQLDEPQWEHDLAALTHGGFVVTWKTEAARGANRKGITVRARVFAASGVPRGPAFNVSASQGQHGQARVYALAHGGFTVMWHRFGVGVYSRLFDEKGAPRTSERLVVSEADPVRGLEPYGYVDQIGLINVFVKLFYALGERMPFRYARTLDATGNAVSAVLENGPMKILSGYQQVVKELVLEQAYALEYRLRAFLEGDATGSQLCSHTQGADAVNALRMREFSGERRMQRFFASFCQRQLQHCGPAEYHEAEQRQCAESP